MAENGGVYEMGWFAKRLCYALSAEGEPPLAMVMWRRAAVGKERVGAARPHRRGVRTWASRACVAAALCSRSLCCCQCCCAAARWWGRAIPIPMPKCVAPPFALRRGVRHVVVGGQVRLL